MPNKVYCHQSNLHWLYPDDLKQGRWQDNKVRNQTLALPHRCQISGASAGFTDADAQSLRHNEIRRETVVRGQGARILQTERLYANRVRVMYRPGGS